MQNKNSYINAPLGKRWDRQSNYLQQYFVQSFVKWNFLELRWPHNSHKISSKPTQCNSNSYY